MLTYGNSSYTYSPNGELQTKINGNDTTRYQYENFGNLIARYIYGTKINVPEYVCHSIP